MDKILYKYWGYNRKKIITFLVLTGGYIFLSQLAYFNILLTNRDIYSVAVGLFFLISFHPKIKAITFILLSLTLFLMVIALLRIPTFYEETGIIIVMFLSYSLLIFLLKSVNGE